MLIVDQARSPNFKLIKSQRGLAINTRQYLLFVIYELRSLCAHNKYVIFSKLECAKCAKCSKYLTSELS
jgi:hypothetical protein